MIKIDVVDSVMDPGSPSRENEDRLGWNDEAVFVVDGATSLGNPVVDPPRSDAAWFAENCAAYLQSNLKGSVPTASVLRALSLQLRDRFEEVTRAVAVDDYQRPTAAFQTLRVIGSSVEVAGLSDCVLFLKDAEGNCVRWSALRAMRSREAYFARLALERSGGFSASGAGYLHSEVLDNLRAGRAKQNVSGGSSWTLGLNPEAADHLVNAKLAIKLPAVAILCTDGFGDLVDAYARHTPDGLIEKAQRDGLECLAAELRHVEREIDPAGTIFPRFKQSDDASAILFRLGEGSARP